eukprot:NODE_9288_length_375_cov_14.190184_g8385_i0.p2 GENE.NODE_9288_length_375_cov_14.190184_g8385_i0~~NODE_9288_length_375_cov_14.190184_g8385_i0.p2  ORF type:complete len:120 (-),score=36.85 NODE_9288_length_375_cov_14.190184_g8385_i0:15-344(-)
MALERYKLLNDLWKAGIKAETVYKDNPNSKKQLDFAFEFGIPIVLWLGESEIERNVVKAKLLNSKEELDIPRDETLSARVKELIDANPVLLAKNEQPEAGKKAEESKQN